MTSKFNTRTQVKYTNTGNNTYNEFFSNGNREVLNKIQHWALIPDRLFTKNLNMWNNRIIDMIGGGIRSGWMFNDSVEGYDDLDLIDGELISSLSLSQYSGKNMGKSIVLEDDVIPFNCRTTNMLFSETSVQNSSDLNKEHLKNIKAIIDKIDKYKMFDKKVSILLGKIDPEKISKEMKFRADRYNEIGCDLNVNLYSHENIKNKVKSLETSTRRYPICNNGLMGRLFFPECVAGNCKNSKDIEKDIEKDIYDIFEPKKVLKDVLMKSAYSGTNYRTTMAGCYNESFYSYGQITSCNTNIGYCFNVSQLKDKEKFGTYQDFFRVKNENRNYNLYGGGIKIDKVDNEQLEEIPGIDDGRKKLEDIFIRDGDAVHSNNRNTTPYLGTNHILFNSLYDDTTYTARRRLGNSSAINNLVSFQYKNSPVYDFTMSYCHYSEAKVDEDLKDPYIFKENGELYIIPRENINNLNGTKYRDTNIFTVCTTAKCSEDLTKNSGLFNFHENITSTNANINNALNEGRQNKENFVDDLMYIGNYNFKKIVSEKYLSGFNMRNCTGGENNYCNLFNAVFDAAGDLVYPFFPMCTFYGNKIAAEDPIKMYKGANVYITLHPPPAPPWSNKPEYKTAYDMSGAIKINDTFKNLTGAVLEQKKQYLKLLKAILSGISYQSQLAFFNNDEVLNIQNQGYTVSLYGTEKYSKRLEHLNCYMTHYNIIDDKLQYSIKEKSTQFDFSIGTKMLSLVLGCLICSADRPRDNFNFYRAINYTNGTPPVLNMDESLIQETSNYSEVYVKDPNNILTRSCAPIMLPVSYKVGDSALDTLTYYQNSNIFNFKSWSNAKINFTDKLFDKYISMYDNGKSLLPIGGYCRYPEGGERSLKTLSEKVLLEKDLQTVLDRETIVPDDIWKQQNGEVYETNSDTTISMGVYKHSLLNNIITDNYDVLGKTANSYVKNLAELIIYISTLGVMLSWLTIYHYTTKGNYTQSVGTNDVSMKYNTCYESETLHPFSIDVPDDKRILPYGLDADKVNKLNVIKNWEKIKNASILDVAGKSSEAWGYKLNYEYGGLLTFIHHNKLNTSIKDYLSIDNGAYVTCDSAYTWRVPSLLYYENEFEEDPLYDVISGDDTTASVNWGGTLLTKDAINTMKPYNVNEVDSKLFYVNSLLYVTNVENGDGDNPKNIDFDDNTVDIVLGFADDRKKKNTSTGAGETKLIKKYRSICNYGGVNTIQYLVDSGTKKKKLKEQYKELYEKIETNYQILKLHTEERALSMVDFWRKLQMIPAYVDGRDFNIKTEIFHKNGSLKSAYKASARNIGGDNGLITIGSGHMELKYDEYKNLVSTSEKIVQKILIKMGITISLRNNFNKTFNDAYLTVDQIKLKEYKDGDKSEIVDKVVLKESKDGNKFFKPLTFYNNIKKAGAKLGLFHNDALETDKDDKEFEKANIIGGTLMTHTNISNVVNEFIELFKDLDDISVIGKSEIDNFKKEYTRALYKVHQTLFEVPLMNYSNEDLGPSKDLGNIKSLIQSINTNELTVYQRATTESDKKIKDTELGYWHGILIPDVSFAGTSSYIYNKYTTEGKTKLKETGSKYSDYMSLFNFQKEEATNKIVQKITIAHQSEFINAFVAMINLISIKLL